MSVHHCNISVCSSRRKTKFVAGLTTFIATSTTCLLLANTAFAQTKIEQMIVTAQKRAQDVQQVPASISAFSGEGLEQRQVKTLLDLTQATPNLMMSRNFGGPIPQLTIRGVSADGFVPGLDTPVALHIDGVYQARALGIQLVFADLESVEVLRGPQGTLYGRNANGGVVNFITKKPTDTFEGSATVFGGSWGRYGARGYVSGPITEGISARLSGVVDRSTGFGKNYYLGTKVDGSKAWGLRAAVRLKPVDDVTIDLSAAQTYEHTNTPIYLNTDTGFPPTMGPNISRLTGLGYKVAFTNEPWRVYNNFDSEQTGIYKSVTGTVSWDITPNIALKSITGWQESLYEALGDFAGIGLSGKAPDAHWYESIYPGINSRTLSQEINLNAKLFDRLDAVVGLYYLNDKLFGAGAGSYFPIGSTSAVPGFVTWSQLASQISTSRAAFLDLTYSVFDNLRLLGGIRRTLDHKETIQGIYQQININGAFGATTSTCGSRFHNVPSLDNHSTTFRGGVQYDFTPDVMGYVQWQDGFKTGGYSTSVCDNGYKPEQIYSWEAGIKSTLFDGAATLNISAFDYRYSNMQVSRVIPANPAAGILIASSTTDNAAKAKITGFEIEANGYITDDLKADLGVGVLDATFGGPFVLQNGSTGVNVISDVGGNTLPRAPKLTLNAGLEYTLRIGDLGELKSRGEYSYSSRVWYSVFNEQMARQDGYSVWNAIFTFTPDACQNLEFKFSARNLLNKGYRVGSLPSGTQISSKGLWGDPRTFLGEVTAKF